jgi:hypothetical protein
MRANPTRRDVLRTGGLLASGALAASALGSNPARAASGPPVSLGAPPPFRVLTAAKTVAARSDRRPVGGGVYDPSVDKTFLSWSGRNEDTYVQAYDHRTGAFSARIKVIGGRGDAHNYPTMVQADDGHLLIFVGMHNVEMVMARSANPHSIDGSWTVRVVPEGVAATYPMPFRAANGHLFVFFRETTKTIRSAPVDTRPLMYMRSVDNGRTWRSSKQLTGDAYALGSTNRSDNLNEIYMGQLRREAAGGGRPERVHMAWAIAGGGPGRHAHAYYLKNMYYVTFDPNTLRFHGAAGADLGTQVNNSDQEESCKVATTPLERPGGKTSPYHIQQTAALADGRPFVVWATHDKNLLFHNHVSVWTGTSWATTEVATGLSVRELEPVNATTWRAYATREAQPNVYTYLVEPGRGWTAEATIVTPKEVQRIELIEGFRDPARLLASGDSSARDVSVADGDIYVLGLPPGYR